MLTWCYHFCRIDLPWWTLERAGTILATIGLVDRDRLAPGRFIARIFGGGSGKYHDTLADAMSWCAMTLDELAGASDDVAARY